MGQILKVAMPKGRIYTKAAEMFRQAGLPIPRTGRSRASWSFPCLRRGWSLFWPSRLMCLLMWSMA